MTKMKFNEINYDLTDQELAELQVAEKRTPIFDNDSPEMTPEMLKHFQALNHKKRVKQTVSLRLSAKTIEQAKSLGKGYTSFLSRLLDVAIQNKEMVKQCL